MSVQMLQVIFNGLCSNKVTERKKTCDSLEQLLKKKRVIEDLDNEVDGESWNGVFNGVKRGFYKETEKIVGQKESTAALTQLRKFNDLLLSVVRIANRRDGVIALESFLNHLKRCLTEDCLRKYCLHSCMISLRDNVLQKVSYWSKITQECWIELFQILKGLQAESEEFKSIPCAIYMFRYGAKHTTPLSCISEEAAFVQAVCQGVTGNEAKVYKEDVLVLFQEFCILNMEDNRSLCCTLGESVLGSLLQIYRPHGPHIEVTIKLFEVLLLQVRIHHPNGACEGEPMAYASYWREWNVALKRIYFIVNNVIENSDLVLYGGEGRGSGKICHVFTELAVEVFRQMCHHDQHNLFPSTESKQYDQQDGPEPKRIRLDPELYKNYDWPWIYITMKVLSKYPGIIHPDDFKIFLSHLVTHELGRQLVKEHVHRCLAVMLDVEAVLIKKGALVAGSLDKLWSTVKDSAMRCMGLNQHTQATHKLLRKLIETRKIVDMQPILEMFFSKAVLPTVDSLKTLDTLLRHYTLPETLPDKDICPRDALIDWALTPSLPEYLSQEVLAKILVGLTLKQWPITLYDHSHAEPKEIFETVVGYEQIENDIVPKQNDSGDSNDRQYIPHQAALKKLLKALAAIGEKASYKKKGEFVAVLDAVLLFLNICVIYENYKVQEAVASVKSLLERNVGLVWELLTEIVDSLYVKQSCSEYIVKAIIKLLELDDKLGYVVRLSVPLEMVRKFFGLLGDEDKESEDFNNLYTEQELTLPSNKLKIFIVKFLSEFVIPGLHVKHQKVMDALLNYEVEPTKPIEYELAMIILKSFTHKITNLDCEALNKHNRMLREICKTRYSEHDVALQVVNIINGVIPQVAASNDGNLQNLYVSVLKPFYQGRNNYGPKVSVALVKCMTKIIKMDPLGEWSSWSAGKDLVVDLIQFLKSDHVTVRLTTVQNLTTPFALTGAEAYKKQKQLHKKICEIVKAYKMEDGQNATDTATILYLFGMILVTNSQLRPQALFELFNVSVLLNLDKEKVTKMLGKIAKEIKLSSSIELLELYLSSILEKWSNQNLSLRSFPYVYYGCSSFVQFCSNYVASIVPLLINEQEPTVFEEVCSGIGKSVAEVIEISYPKVFAKMLVLRSFKDATCKFNVSPEDLVVGQAVQDRIAANLSEEKIKEITLALLHEIIECILGHVYDAEHFSVTFQCEYPIPEPEETFLSVEIFKKTLDLLQEKVNTGKLDLLTFLVCKQPKKVQQLLLKLSCNVQRGASVEDKVLAFYRRVVVLELINEHYDTKHNLKPFLIRDTTFTLLNLIKLNYDDESILNLLAAKYLLNFIDVVLPRYSDIFVAFLMVIASTLIPIAMLNTPLASICLEVLKKLVVQHASCLKTGIMILDPFPEDAKFEELTGVYCAVKYGNKECGLGTEVEYFLKAGDGIKRDGCRVEGLRHLRKQLKAKKNDLKELYADLYKSRGMVDSDSVLHRLICVLVKLTKSKDQTESLEASKCLGELGPADLTTMVLKSEDSVESVAAHPLTIFATKVVSMLTEYVVDEDIDVVVVACGALHELFCSTEGKQIGKIANNQLNIEYLTPFMLDGAKKKSLSIKNVRSFLDTLGSENLWCPCKPMQYSEWIVNLVCSILSHFEDGVYFKKLIPVAKLKVGFAENLLPLLVNVILDLESTVPVISQSIGRFFERHWSAQWSADKSSACHIAMLKPAVRSMLKIVDFVRLQRSSAKKTVVLNLNYLHVALAAKFCSAYFSSIMYAEFWSQGRVVEIRNGDCPFSANATIFDDLREYCDETKYLQCILQQCCNDIGDYDYLKNNQFFDPLDPKSQANIFNDLHRWDLLALHYDVESSYNTLSVDSNDHLRALKNMAWFKQVSTMQSNDYETLWRIGNWKVSLPPLDTEKLTFEETHYRALKAFAEGDCSSFLDLVDCSRRAVISSLKHASLESCKNLYQSLMRLQFLQDLEDVYNSTEKRNVKDCIADWNIKSSINQNEFQYIEPVLAHRVSLLRIVEKKQKNAGVVKEALVDLHLNLAEMARFDGNINVAKRAIGDILHTDMTDEVKALVLLEDAQVNWKVDQNFGLRTLRHLLNNYKDDSMIRAKALKLYGSWMVETKSESSQAIIDNYFLKSVNILGKMRDANNKTDSFYDAYEMLAQFADQKYQQIHRYTQSPLFQGKIENMEKLKSSAEKMRSGPNAKVTDVKRAFLTAERQSKLDETEIGNTLREKNIYLTLAVRYYLHHLKFSNKNNITMFRILSLWLENKGNKDVIKLMTENLAEIPSHKILLILPQLVPHITCNTEGDAFATQINLLIERCAVDHPHHAVPVILSVANSNLDEIYTKQKTSTETNELRIVGAQRMMQKLKRTPALKNMIGQMEHMFDALVQLANYNCGQDSNDNTPVAIPPRYKIRSINNYTEILMPTYTLPVNITGSYSNVIGVYKFQDEFSLVGGLNAPKRIKCRGTDGIVRPQLVKGKDDLRQDAVMQQVFTIMNNLLARDKQTKNLLIRTYKIVPLSRRSGILEWVQNTMSLGEYLVGEPGAKGVHQTHNPSDITPRRCREEFKNMASDSYDTKLRKYLSICKRFRPAFHKFFDTTFLQPTVWYDRKRSYTYSVATSSMCGYILGLGDRHVNNILVDKHTAEVVHIDFGIAFEQGKVLPTPETIPFRLTRDIEAGMGIFGPEGTFRRSCEKTLDVLRNNSITILSILEVLLYDPLYEWTITPAQAYSRQFDEEDGSPGNHIVFSNEGSTQLNVTAERALNRLREKLQGTEYGGSSSVEGQVKALIQQARDPTNLCKLFHGWQPYL